MRHEGVVEAGRQVLRRLRIGGQPAVVGYLFSGRRSPITSASIAPLHEGLAVLGLRQGRDYRLLVRYAEGNYGAFPDLMRELLDAGVAVVVVQTILAAQTAMAVAPHLPVIMDGLNDPVAVGLLQSLERPGGKITGTVNMTEGMIPSMLDSIRAMIPDVQRIAVLHQPANPSNAKHLGQAAIEAGLRGLKLDPRPVASLERIGAVLSEVVADRPDAILVMQDSMFKDASAEILAPARAARIPVFSTFREIARDGGVLADTVADLEPPVLASYVAQILAGAQPGDLPAVVRPRRLVINAAAAGSLGIGIPPELLAQADEVITGDAPSQRGRPAARPGLRVPLSLKFAAAFVGLVTLVLLVNGAVNLWLSYEEAKHTAVRVQQEMAHAASERIDGFVTAIESQIGWTTRQEWRRIGLEQQRYDFIRLLRQAPAITELAYLDGAGREQLKVSRLEPDAVGSNADFSTEPRFAKAVEDKIWFGPVYFRRGSEPYMTIAVAHAGRGAGVTVAEVNLKLIWDVITAIRVGRNGYAYVVDQKGRLIAHPDMSLVLRDTDLSRLPQVAAALNAPRLVRTGASGEEQSTAATGTALDGTSVITAHDSIARLGWIVLVQLPVSEALAPVYTSLTQTGALLALGLLLALTAGTYLSRRMVVPIHKLQHGAERLGEGDLSQRIAIRTGDEIETLADRFNLMASRIQESYETLEAKVEERTRDLNEALEQQIATAEVLKVISRSAFDLQTVLETLVASASQLCRAEMGLISLAKDGVFVPQASYGTPPGYLEFMQAHPFKPGRETFSGRAAITGQVVNVADALDDPEYKFTEARDRAGYRAMLAVPLLRQGEVIGVLAMPRRAPGAFTDRQVELAQTFADQAVIAIENARLFQEVEARTRDLTEALEQQTATADVLKVISRSAFDLQTVLDTLCASAVRLCDADKGVIFQRDQDEYRLVANHGFSADFEVYARAHPLKIDRGSTAGRVAIEGRTIHVPDVLADPEYTAAGFQQHGGYRTNLGVPLLREGMTIGVFVLTRPEVKPFTERQVELIESFADQAVIAMENARLFKAVKRRTKELKRSLEDLQTAQDRLVQTEKLASLGQLTAGIAHEIKNPLNFVNNFSSLSSELVEELQEALAGAPLDDKSRADVEEITTLLRGNLDKVVHHGKRADSIVKNMLLHSRDGSGERRSVDLNATVEESLNLAYHGAWAEKPGFNVTLQKGFDPAVGPVDIYPQEFIRVLLNLVSNGFYAAAKKKAEGGGPSYEPTLSVTTKALPDCIEIRIRDNGTGIPDEVKAKMFNPFFTTKPAGEGTGLGLSLSHDIVVKQHGGTIAVETEPGAFTEFVITLPRQAHAAELQRAS